MFKSEQQTFDIGYPKSPRLTSKCYSKLKPPSTSVLNAQNTSPLLQTDAYQKASKPFTSPNPNTAYFSTFKLYISNK